MPLCLAAVGGGDLKWDWATLPLHAASSGLRTAGDPELLSPRPSLALRITGAGLRTALSDHLTPTLPRDSAGRTRADLMHNALYPHITRSLIGASSVGKSSLLLRFTDETFLSPDETSGECARDPRVRLARLPPEGIAYARMYPGSDDRSRLQGQGD